MDNLEKDFVFAIEWSEQRLASFFPYINRLKHLEYYDNFTYGINNHLKRVARVDYNAKIGIASKGVMEKNLNAECVFIHEISEWVFGYWLGGGDHHWLARYIENIRRNELGLDENILL